MGHDIDGMAHGSTSVLRNALEGLCRILLPTIALSAVWDSAPALEYRVDCKALRNNLRAAVYEMAEVERGGGAEAQAARRRFMELQTLWDKSCNEQDTAPAVAAPAPDPAVKAGPPVTVTGPTSPPVPPSTPQNAAGTREQRGPVAEHDNNHGVTEKTAATPLSMTGRTRIKKGEVSTLLDPIPGSDNQCFWDTMNGNKVICSAGVEPVEGTNLRCFRNKATGRQFCNAAGAPGDDNAPPTMANVPADTPRSGSAGDPPPAVAPPEQNNASAPPSLPPLTAPPKNPPRRRADAPKPPPAPAQPPRVNCGPGGRGYAARARACDNQGTLFR